MILGFLNDPSSNPTGTFSFANVVA